MKKIIIVISIIFISTGCATMTGDWEKAKKLDHKGDPNAIANYELFLRNYPSSPYSKSANERLEKLRYNPCNDGNEEACRLYLVRYPKGIFTDDAKRQIDRLMFSRAKLQGTMNSYQAYLDEFPNGINSIAAHEKIQELLGLTEAYLNAVKTGDEVYADSILRKITDGNIKIKNGETLLLWAVSEGKSNIVEYLLRLGASKEEQLMKVALARKDTKVIRVLLENHYQKNLVSALYSAATNGDIETVKLFKQHDVGRKFCGSMSWLEDTEEGKAIEGTTTFPYLDMCKKELYKKLNSNTGSEFNNIFVDCSEASVAPVDKTGLPIPNSMENSYIITFLFAKSTAVSKRKSGTDKVWLGKCEIKTLLGLRAFTPPIIYSATYLCPPRKAEECLP